MAQIAAYRDYFMRHPPVHMLAAAYIGYKPSSKSAPLLPPPPDIEE